MLTTGEIENETVTSGYLDKDWNDLEEEELVELKIDGLAEQEQEQEEVDPEKFKSQAVRQTEDGDDEEQTVCAISSSL
jgi:hypothetical protein